MLVLMQILHILCPNHVAFLDAVQKLRAYKYICVFSS